MQARHLLATAFAMLFHASVGLPVQGQGPGCADPIDQSFSDADTFWIQDSQEQILGSSIDFGDSGFVSRASGNPWSIGTELVAFRTRYRGVDFTDSGGDDKYIGSLRLLLSWESDSGFGVRGRIWGQEIDGKSTVSQFPGTSANLYSYYLLPGSINYPSYYNGGLLVSSPSPIESTLGTGFIDFDFFKRFGAGKTDLIVGAGLRAAGLEFEIKGISKDTVSTGGISLFSDLRHVLYQSETSELAFIGGGRVAWLSGEWEHEDTFSPSTSDANLTTSEAALGLEWKRNLGWSVLSLRGQYETQFWDNDVTNDITFSGGVVRVGLSW